MNIQVISWKKAVLALALVATVATAGFLSTRAFFSDTETSAANVFSAGSLNLKVGINAPGSTWPTVAPRDNNNQQLFAIGGLMPGQVGTGELRLVSEGGDAWACVSAEITKNPENTRLSQEASSGDTTAGSNTGELKDYMEVAIWEANGLANSDGIVGPNEKETLQVVSLEDFASGDFWTLQDSDHEDNPLMDGAEYRHEFAYCFGTFSNATDVATSGGVLECDGNVAGTNQAQTDGVEVLLNFYAEQMENNENFVCGDLNPNEWTEDGTVAGGDVAFAADPSAPLGLNSLQLTTVNDNASRVRYNHEESVDLLDVTGLSYESKQVSSAAAIGNATFRLIVDLDGDLNTTGDVAEVTYEPYYNINAHNSLNSQTGTVNGTWQTWAADRDNGKFWGNGITTVHGLSTPNGGSYATNFTLDELSDAYANAKVIGINIGMGTWNADQVVLVDNLNFNGTVYDFEN